MSATGPCLKIGLENFTTSIRVLVYYESTIDLVDLQEVTEDVLCGTWLVVVVIPNMKFVRSRIVFSTEIA